MTKEEEILRSLDEMKRSHEAFFAEWRAARVEAQANQEALKEERLKGRAAIQKNQRDLRVQVAVIVILVLLFFYWQGNHRKFEEMAPKRVQTPAAMPAHETATTPQESSK